MGKTIRKTNHSANGSQEQPLYVMPISPKPKRQNFVKL